MSKIIVKRRSLAHLRWCQIYDGDTGGLNSQKMQVLKHVDSHKLSVVLPGTQVPNNETLVLLTSSHLVEMKAP